MANTELKITPPRLFPSFRFAHSFLMAFGSMSLIMNQATLLSFAIVCMTKSHSACQSGDYNVTEASDELACNSNSTESTAEFDWSNELKGRLLGSTYYGLLCTQLLGGIITNKLGGGRVLVVSAAFVCGILTIISPTVLRYNVNVFFVMRLFIGGCFGLYNPSQMPLLAPWSVPAEQGFLVGFAYAGYSLASMVNNPISGFMCKNFGWPAIFYFNGSLTFSWSIIAFFFIHNSPEAHPFISDTERNFIVANRRHRPDAKKPPVPWRSIVTSLPVWTVFMTYFFHFAGHVSVLQFQPTYMREVLHFTVAEIGLISAIPTTCAAIMHFFVGPIYDCVRNSNRFSVTVTRKLFSAFGLFAPALALVGLSQVPPTYKYVAVALIATCLATTEFGTVGGFLYAFLDMAPQYSGVLDGMSCTIGTTPGFFMPMIISAITNNGTPQEWRNVMLLLAGLYTTGGLIFLIFSRSELLPWAASQSPPSSQEKPSETEPLKDKKSPKTV